jgi:hypothetical protein
LSNKNFLAVDVVGDVIENVELPLIPPPGVGVETDTVAVPTLATNVAETEAVNCVALTYVVVSDVPFHKIVEPFIKLLPVTVNVNAALPATLVLGLIELKTGIGFPAAV